MKTPRLPRTRRGHHVPPWRRVKLATSDRVADISRDLLSVDSMREFVERGRKAQEAVDQLTREDRPETE